MATYAENDFKLSMKPFKGCTSTNDGKSGKVPQPLKTNGDSTKYLKGDGTWADADATKLGGQLPSYYAKKSDLDTTNANIGNKTNLTTTEKSTIVGAINENKSHIDTINTNVGDKSNLTTTEKSTIVGAINENKENIDTETTNRTTADTALGIRIDTETTNRATADTNLQGQIDDILDGTTTVPKASHSVNSDVAKTLDSLPKVGNHTAHTEYDDIDDMDNYNSFNVREAQITYDGAERHGVILTNVSINASGEKYVGTQTFFSVETDNAICKRTRRNNTWDSWEKIYPAPFMPEENFDTESNFPISQTGVYLFYVDYYVNQGDSQFHVGKSYILIIKNLEEFSFTSNMSETDLPSASSWNKYLYYDKRYHYVKLPSASAFGSDILNISWESVYKLASI